MHQIKIGVFGSAFNPPTLGHLDVLKQAAGAFEKILLVPSASHAFAKTLLPFSDRAEMLKLFLADAGTLECEVEICELEMELLRRQPDKPVYTFDLMQELEEHYPDNTRIGFIRGPDNADPETWRRFYRAREIEQRWMIFTADERMPIRSSTVRELIGSMKSDDTTINQASAGHQDDLDNMLMPSVRRYILEKGLYQS
ncbi:MAG: adenylyltransferase/cytidyltransferase family protein [Endozoicomonas sp.]